MKRLTILTIIWAGFTCMTASGTVIHIPDDYPTIQQGIDSCAFYDTILVANGTYCENIYMYFAISLIGQERDNTIIDGSGTGDVVFVAGPGMLISNFTIRNSGIGYEDAGIELSLVDSCIIECCDIEDNNSGLCLYGSSYNLISRCRFSGNVNSVHFREDLNMMTPDNVGNAINNNIIEFSDLSGIFFEHTLANHHTSNVATGNRIFNNDTGASTIMSQENLFAYNDLVGSAGYGAVHAMCFGGGELNQFHHNNFILNNAGTTQAVDIGGGIDYWYSVAGEKGNYWSDYTGPDTNGNGIGDIPYYIDGGESQDLYPLMEPLISTIAGGVSDGVNPITGAYVQALGTNIDDYTDSDGMYSLEGLGAGFYDVGFIHPLYQSTTELAVPATLAFTTALNVVMEHITGIEGNGIPAPAEFTLMQNFPNPFNSETKIKFSIVNSMEVRLAVYDLLGREVQILVDDYRPAGEHVIDFRGAGIPSGIYFYSLKAGDSIETKKMLLLK